MRHPSLTEWENNLEKVLHDLDDILEDKYGMQYKLHPARPARGTTSRKAHDGLFNINKSFSLGIGSKHGKGYVIDVQIATLEDIPEKVQNEIDRIVLQTLQKKLPHYFPGKNLHVNKEGNIIKIYGDLSLGKL